MKLLNTIRFCGLHRGQQTDSTSCAQSPIHGGRSYIPLDDILHPPAKDMINNIVEESDDDAEIRCPTPRHRPTTKTGFQVLDRKLLRRISGQQQCLEVFRNRALGFCADPEQSVATDDDVAWQHEYNHIVNPPTAGFLANTRHTCSHLAAN